MGKSKSLVRKNAIKIHSFYGLIIAGIILIFSSIWSSANAATFINGMYYVLNSQSQTASLASATGEYGNFGGYAGDVVIPSSVTYQDVEYTVTAIQDRCFYNCKDLTSLTIPASVKTISGTHVFYGCSGIKRVVLEDSNNSITIPGCVYSTEYGNTKATFHYAKLESVYVGRSIKMSSSSDSDSPFYGQSTLSNVVIGDNVKELPRGFVYGCAISQISIPEGVTKIGNYAFAYCPNLYEIIFPNSLEEIGWGCCSGSAIEKAFIGDNVKVIEGTFHSCDKLKSVYLGSGITTIGRNTFAWSSLAKLYLFSDELTTLDSPGFPEVLSQIFVCNPERYRSLFQDKYLSNIILFNNSTSIYSGGIPTLSYQNNASETTVEYTVPNEYINVGTYSIAIPITFKYKGWRSQTSIMVSYDITAAPLSVIPESTSRQYGTPNPTLKCSFFGFKNNETIDVLTRLPNVETTANVNSPVGTYPIIATGAEAQNYTFNYERGTLTVTKANQEIEWSQSFGVVNVGAVVELTASSTSSLPVKYTSTDESIAEIYSQGGKKFVEFLKPGTVSIRANQEGNENYNEADRVSKSVTVASLVKEVILNQTSVNLNEGDTYQLTAIISPSDAPNKTLEWSSSNTEVATVDANGEITAIKQGQATITAKTADGSNITATCEVKVLKLVSDIVLDVSSASLAEGQTLQLNATITPEQADDKTLQWISSNEAIATVDQSGLVTAVAKGSAKIRVESVDGSGVYAECDVEVYPYSGINTISADGIQITTEPFIATIHGVEEGTVIRLFDMSGNILYLGSEPRVEVGQTGLYILVVNNKAYKIKL